MNDDGRSIISLKRVISGLIKFVAPNSYSRPGYEGPIIFVKRGNSLTEIGTIDRSKGKWPFDYEKLISVIRTPFKLIHYVAPKRKDRNINPLPLKTTPDISNNKKQGANKLIKIVFKKNNKTDDDDGTSKASTSGKKKLIEKTSSDANESKENVDNQKDRDYGPNPLPLKTTPDINKNELIEIVYKKRQRNYDAIKNDKEETVEKSSDTKGSKNIFKRIKNFVKKIYGNQEG